MTEIPDHIRRALDGPDSELWVKLLQRVDDFVRGLTRPEIDDILAGRSSVTIAPFPLPPLYPDEREKEVR
jgi:hypothetical protein